MVTTPYEIQPVHTTYADEDSRMESKESLRIVSVHRIEIPDDITADLAAGTLDLLAAAYANQFEVRRALLPEGTFRRFFDSTDDDRVSEQVDRMKGYVDSGSSYSLIFDRATESMVVALAKVSPSRASKLQKLGITSPNAYLNDIAVDPGSQERKLASLALFDQLGEERFDQSRTLAADGFEGADIANDWFWRMGMREVDVELEPTVFDGSGIGLPQRRFSSEGVTNIGSIAARLAERLNVSLETDS